MSGFLLAVSFLAACAGASWGSNYGPMWALLAGLPGIVGMILSSVISR